MAVPFWLGFLVLFLTHHELIWDLGLWLDFVTVTTPALLTFFRSVGLFPLGPFDFDCSVLVCAPGFLCVPLATCAWQSSLLLLLPALCVGHNQQGWCRRSCGVP